MERLLTFSFYIKPRIYKKSGTRYFQNMNPDFTQRYGSRTPLSGIHYRVIKHGYYFYICFITNKSPANSNQVQSARIPDTENKSTN